MSSLVHLDADAFFASVEQAADPRLRGKPVAVGGERRGIIASASYEARRCGVFTPMPTARARKLCPKLILLPGDFDKYERFSRWMFSYAYDFTPDVEIGSIDEGYFDLTAVRKPAIVVARTIRDAIRQALKITVSEGLGSNKLVCQIASKLKKPAAFVEVPAGGEAKFLRPLRNRWLPGIGPTTSARFNAAGLVYISQIAATPTDLLALLVGRAAPQLKDFANGIDPRPVVPASEPAKSYSQQETFAQDQTDEEFLAATLRRMADHLFAKVRADAKSVRTLTVKIRYNDMDEAQCSESLAEPTDLESDVYGLLHTLLRRAWQRRVSLRLVGLKLANLYGGVFRSELALDRAAQGHEARRRLAAVVDELRGQHGHSVVMRGHDLLLAERNPKSEIRSSKEIRSPKSEVVPCRPRGAVSGFGLRASGLFTPIPLGVRSHFSFLNSTLSIPAILELAQRHQLPAVALCDQGNLHGAVEFVAGARAAGIKPILGAEIRWQGRLLRLFVENQHGYANLCRLLSRNPKSEIRDPKEIRNPKSERGAEKTAGRQFQATRGQPAQSWPTGPVAGSDFGFRVFGDTSGLLAVGSDPALAPLFPGRFYFGVSHPDELRRLENPARLPLAAFLPIHYAVPADRWRFDIVQSIRTLTLLRQAHPEKQSGGAWHFRPPAELRELFHAAPTALAGANELAERCNFTFTFGQPQFPAFPPPDGSPPRAFLRELVWAGARRRYPAAQLAKLKAQIEEELRIIAAVGYEDYFLITWELLGECRARGIDWITRGSAADSLVCYCLGISDVCPARFELYFRRFLNLERMAMHKLPDIDIDFPHDRKDDVVDLLFAKYGPAHCAVVGGFNTYQARGAVGDVAKVLGVSEHQVRRFTERFPWGFGGGWEMPEFKLRPSSSSSAASTTTKDEGRGRSENRLVALLRANPETRDLPLDEEPYRSALAMAEFLEGVPRYPKMHPCGVVLSRQPMHELTPTFLSGKGYPTTHFDMDAVEAIGLVKMDILAQGGLAAMRDVKGMLRERGVTVDLERFEVAGEGMEKNPKSEIRNPKEVRNPKSEAGARGDTAGGEWALREQPVQLPLTGPAEDSDFEFRTSDFLRISDFEFRISAPLLVNPQPPPHRFDDPEIWDMIASGGARAVHHIESPAMTSLCRQCQVRDIDTLIAIVSVIRPGAANEDKKREFARRYQGLSPVTYPHPSLEPCLRSTFGLVVYEEHILQICEAFAGLPGGRADVLRRALVKEKLETVAEIGKEFFACARARGHAEEKIAEVWKLVTGFHGYAFCKAHSTAYGVEAYQSAWLKRHFPAEFMTAVLTNGKGFYTPLVYVLECWRLGLALRPPWVNEPGPGFRVVAAEVKEGEANPKSEIRDPKEARNPKSETAGQPVPASDFGFRISLRIPVTYVKGLSERTQERLLSERQRGVFVSLADFFLRVRPTREEMETLSRVGALDGFGRSRCEQFWEIQQLVVRWGDHAAPGQGWLLPPPEMFASSSSSSLVLEDKSQPVEHDDEGRGRRRERRGPTLEEPTRLQRLQWESELLGFPASGHPLELYGNIAWETYCPVARLGEHVGERVVTCGLVIEQRLHHQENGEPMKFLTLADWTGMVETELFAATYKSHGLATVRYPVLEVEATVEPFENGRGFSLRVHRAGPPRARTALPRQGDSGDSMNHE